MIQSNISIKLESFEVPSLARELNPSKAVAVAAAAPCVSSSQQAPVNPSLWLAPRVGPRSFLLSEIPAEDLLKMCDDFKAEVFKRAGYPLPSTNIDWGLELFKANICEGFAIKPSDVVIEQYAKDSLTIYIHCIYDKYEGLKKRCRDVMPDGLTLHKLIIQRPG